MGAVRFTAANVGGVRPGVPAVVWWYFGGTSVVALVVSLVVSRSCLGGVSVAGSVSVVGVWLVCRWCLSSLLLVSW